jgi:hypothetical protein
MRLISGTVKSTQLQWLPLVANIAPTKLRREATTVRELVNCMSLLYARSLLYDQMLDFPDQSLLSRRSVWNFDPHPSTTLFSIPKMPGLRHCDCGEEKTMRHIVDDYPLRLFAVGLGCVR